MNFIRILSKSSLRSSSSSGKSLPNSEEFTKLQAEVDSLKQVVESLKVSLESKDAAIGTLAREKEKLYVELKSAQRTNRNLHQQLVDERDIHFKEKEYLIEEIKRLTKNDEYDYNGQQDTCLDELQFNYSLKEEIKAKDEIICNICSKYLKIKASKKVIQKKFVKLQLQSQNICENIILLLQENRCTLDSLLTKLIGTSSVSPDSKKYLSLLRINANLHYENTQLKVRLSQQGLPEQLSAAELNKQGKTNLTTGISKSEAKLATKYSNLQSRYRSLQSKLIKIHGRTFKKLHGTFSPSFRRRIYGFNSDPCIALK